MSKGGYVRTILIAFIHFYQRYISPYKGFRCAYAVYNQEDSCSHVIEKIIEVHGVFHGYGLIRQQFKNCNEAYIQLSQERNNKEQKNESKWYDYCDPSAACNVHSCWPKKGYDGPDLPCDCSPF